MKKILYLLLCSALVLTLNGCRANNGDPNFRDEAAYDEREGFAESLKSDYLSLRKKYPEQKNDICFYVMAQEEMPENREVKLCFTDVYADGWREAKAMEITSNGVEVSNERRVFTF